MMRRIQAWFVAVVVLGALIWALVHLPETPASLTAEAHQALAQSGVTNPVTAVLLNYRSYDTLLELGVLLLAVVAVWSLRRANPSSFARPAGSLLESLLRYLLPLLLLTAGYLLWIGSFAPGGAFQGGALLGGAIVLILLGGLAVGRLAGRSGLLKSGLYLGLAVFLVLGLGVMLFGGRLLEYPTGQAKTLILLIETAALISIGLTLGGLFYGGRPDSEDHSSTSVER
jgi:multisubunit Na+/H+ antiporter MnhB subunit